MISDREKNRNKGFALVAAIFILVVLSLLGIFLVRIFTVGSASTRFSIQGTRAYFAAKSAFDWAVYQAVVNSNCPASTTISMTQAGVSGFSAVVQCSSLVTSEGTLYTITAQSQKGTFGTLDYVSRSLTGTVVQ